MILYYLILKPISFLPQRLLYILSDFLYFLLYRVFKYRHAVIYGNISRSFPDKSMVEVELIAKNFYAHFCDLIVEGLANFSRSEEEIRRRVVCKNPEVFDKYVLHGKSVILAGGHFNNWEMAALGMALQLNGICFGIYKPLKNKFIDNKLKQSREKTGLRFISTKEVGPNFEKNKGIATITMFLTDQNPSNHTKAHWMNFLNQDTAVLFGVEKYAKHYNLPVFYGEMTKVKRGFYEITFREIIEDPSIYETGKITEIHTHELEKSIIKNPSYWLWSHKRWKHKRN